MSKANLSSTYATRSSSQTPADFAVSLLRKLKIPESPGAVQSVEGWANAEGGHWHNDARYNPLNTTQPEPGAGNTGTQGNIKVYRNWQQGIDATAKTLRNGRYGGILSALKAGDPSAVASAIGQSPWGTSGDLVAKSIASASGQGGTALPSAPAASATMTLQHGTETLTQTDPALVRKQFFAQWLAKKNPNNPLIRLGAVDPNMSTTSTTSLPTTTGFKVSSATPGAGGGISPSNANTAALTERADEIDEKHLPYLWGGGHGGKVNPAKAQPLDCSGAVSAVLGIDPRVASQFETWGKPGDSGKKGVTIYAKDTHVLMKIDGHMFGTSASNPGGGAGWIKQDQISPAYLKGFTVRHA